MKMRDDKGEDDKLISVHADDPNYAHYSDVSEIPPHRLRELQRFFEDRRRGAYGFHTADLAPPVSAPRG